MYYVTGECSGKRRGIFPLTWGQLWIWKGIEVYRPDHANFCLFASVDVPESCGMDHVLAALRRLMDHHETLRTTFDSNGRTVPVQVLHDSYFLRLEMTEATPDLLADVVDRQVADLSQVPFAEMDLPVRVGVVTIDGAPKYVTLVISHLAVDDWSMNHIVREYRALLALGADSAEVDLQPVSHPVDRVHWESSVEGLRQSDRGLEYWRQEALKFPRSAVLTTKGDVDGLRYKQFRMHSPALALAARVSAREYRCSVGSFILSHSVKLLGEANGHAAIGLLIVSSNRFSSRAKGYSGTLATHAPLFASIGNVLPRDLMQAIGADVIRSVLRSECNPYAALQTIESVGEERGSIADISCSFNLRLLRNDPTQVRLASLSESFAEASQLAAKTKVEHGRDVASTDMGFDLVADSSPDEFTISLRADTARMSSNAIIEFLLDIERSAIDSLRS